MRLAMATMASDKSPVTDHEAHVPRFVYSHECRRPLGFEYVFVSFEPSFYVPSSEFRGRLNPVHQQIVEKVADIPGKLMRADYAKLYEAAYFARGAVVEIGRLTGLSTAVLALGLQGGGVGAPFFSIDLPHPNTAIAAANLRGLGLQDLVTLLEGDSAELIPRLPAPLDTVFVDGDHSFEGVVRDMQALNGRLASGAVVMFHDAFHGANADGRYGVSRALEELSDDLRLEYRGRFGGIALYEYCGDPFGRSGA
jgi:predicted O-methyltransferase YrrM